MKTLKALTVGVVSALGIAGFVFGVSTATQTVTMQVNAICVLAVTGSPSTLTISAPATGGQTPSNPSSNTTYAQYTSTVGASQTRKITAAWGGSDAAPAGCSLKLTATPSGGTNQGTSTGQITMSATAQDVVTTIRSCATGTSASNGAQLTYALSVDTVTSLVASESKSATVTLTLTDAA
ncbi:MAG: hypothetical protein ABSF88_11490 [Candidatus Aminicenantales bacterium]